MDTVQFFAEDVELPFSSDEANAYKHWLFLVAETEMVGVQQINYIFCSDEYLLGINREYLNHDYYTDIITFDNSDDDCQLIESDIFISTERVRANADVVAVTFQKELSRVMVHGLLHLCGYQDKSEAEIQTMRNKEDYYLSLQ